LPASSGKESKSLGLGQEPEELAGSRILLDLC
jgi:hypothetical protein